MKNKIILAILVFALFGGFYLAYPTSYKFCEGSVLTQFEDREYLGHFHITSDFGDIFRDVSLTRGRSIPEVIYLEPNLTYISSSFSQTEIDMLQKCYNKTKLVVTEIF